MPRKRVVDPDDPMAVLARIALEERAEKIQEKQSKARANKIALDQHYTQEDNAAKRRARFQAVCDHLAGNHAVGVVPDIRRCALHKHTYSSKLARIYCDKCRFEWRPGDRPDHIIRVDGEGPKRLPNPTKMGWTEIAIFLYLQELQGFD